MGIMVTTAGRIGQEENLMFLIRVASKMLCTAYAF